MLAIEYKKTYRKNKTFERIFIFEPLATSEK